MHIMRDNIDVLLTLFLYHCRENFFHKIINKSKFSFTTQTKLCCLKHWMIANAICICIFREENYLLTTACFKVLLFIWYFFFRWCTHLYNTSLFLFIRQSVCPSICLFIAHHYITFSVHPSVYLSIHLSVHWARYLKNHTSSDHNFWYTYAKWWYLQV